VFSERNAVCGRHDPAPAAVQESNAECVFQLNNRLGNGGLGDVEPFGRFAHAPCFNNGQQNIEVAQLQSTLGALVPRHEN
jgi:hypothetical protein